MLPVAVKIGPFTFYLYGLVIAASVYLGWILARSRAHFYKIPRKLFEDPVLILPLILAIIGARLYHVLDYWSYYSENLILILQLNRGGLGIWGGLAGALLGFWLVAKLRDIDFLTGLDLAAPSLLLGQALGRIANYINQEGFGPPTNLPWGIFIKGENRPMDFILFSRFHPTFFYEAVIDLLFLVVLLYFEKRNKKKGKVFALYLVLYSLGRFFVEFFRIDTAKLGDFKVAQMLAVVTFLFGAFLFTRQNRLDKR